MDFEGCGEEILKQQCDQVLVIKKNKIDLWIETSLYFIYVQYQKEEKPDRLYKS